MMSEYMKKYGCLALLICGGMTFQARAADSTQVTFNMSVPNPTCNINITGGGISDRGVISLGELKRSGTDEQHNSFEITGHCNSYVGPSGNYINASVIRGGQLLNDNVHIAVKMDSNPVNTTAGPFLKLKENNADVKLDGTTKFCKSGSDGNIRCTLTPYTNVQAGAPAGSGSAVVQFTVHYSV